MKSNQDRPETIRKPDSAAAAPRKRFRIEKLEERIAPNGGGGTQTTAHCTTFHCGSRSN